MAVLTFPQRNKGRVRRSDSMDAAGFLTLMLMDREGKAIPQNVQRFDEPDGPDLPARSPEILFLLLLWSELPAKRRERIRKTIQSAAYDRSPDPCFVQLRNLLALGARSC